MPTVRPRARDTLPISQEATEATLTRRAPASLRRVSVLCVGEADADNIGGQIADWLAILDDRDGEVIVVHRGGDERRWQAITRCAARDYRVRPLRLPAGCRTGEALQRAAQAMCGDIAIVSTHGPQGNGSYLADVITFVQQGADAVVLKAARTSFAERIRQAVFKICFGRDLPQRNAPMAVRADVLKHLRFTSRGPELGAEIPTRLLQWGAKVKAIVGAYGDSKLGLSNAGRDAWRVIRSRAWDTQFTSHAGFYILTAVAKADQYNRWIVEQVRPYLGQRVMEAGAGIGNLSPLFGDCERLLLVDREHVYLERLESRFQRDARVRVASIDLTNKAEVASCAHEKIDTIFCSNVLEHLEPDEQVLRSFTDTLVAGGHCVIVVPAGEKLYTGIDAALGHYRRYEPEQLAEKMRAAGLEVAFTKRFSRLGTIGWAVSGHVLRRRTLSPRQMIWFDRLLPIAKLLEYLLPVPGMSLIMVGRKPLAAAKSVRHAA